MLSLPRILAKRTCVVALGLVCIAAVRADDHPLYLDPGAPVENRVKDLLGRMTIDEKIGQVTGAWIHPADVESSKITLEQYFAKNLAYGVGSVAPVQNVDVAADVAFRNRLQEFLVHHTRLGIPAMFHDEGCHGVVERQASSFPVPIGLACSWDPSLAEKIYNVVAAEMRSRGAQQALAPVVDVARDPRWGRFDETMGEDPFLNARMGAAIVRGLQGSADGSVDGSHVVSTLKHFTGHGTPEGGLNRSPSVSSPRTLREVDLQPFAYIIRNAHPGAVMPSYNEIDGVPSHGNRWLLQDVLRDEFGFRGLIVSDYDGIKLLNEGHHVAASDLDAGVLALEAGVQIELPVASCFVGLKEALGRGTVKMSELDEAAAAVLALKIRLGLFEHPFADAAVGQAAAERADSRQLSLTAARESIVLLKNNGVLPLNPEHVSTIAVIGPNAAVARLGSYSGTPTHSVSLLEGVRARFGSRTKVLFAQGCLLVKNDSGVAFDNWHSDGAALAKDSENASMIEEARKVAAQADVVLLAVGETERLSREAWSDDHLGDVDSLDLPGSQNALIDAVLSVGKPVVVILNNGRPLSIGGLKDRASAILEAWYAGQEAGTAAAEILAGDTCPSGKLTASFPASVGDIPAYYSKKPYAGPFAYELGAATPLWRFGDGLSYTTFSYSGARLEKSVIPTDGTTVASVEVTNSGKVEGDEIVQLYVHQNVSSVTRAVKELKGFARIHLGPGERRTVSFPVGADALGLWDTQMHYRVEPGLFEITLGPSSHEGEVVKLSVSG